MGSTADDKNENMELLALAAPVSL